MEDPKVSRTTYFAWTAWIVGGLMLAAAWAVFDDSFAAHLGRTGLAVIGVAMTLHTRQHLCDNHQALKRAFDFGREYESGQQRELRSI